MRHGRISHPDQGEFILGIISQECENGLIFKNQGICHINMLKRKSYHRHTMEAFDKTQNSFLIKNKKLLEMRKRSGFLNLMKVSAE